MDLQEVGCGGIGWIDLFQDGQVAGFCEWGNELRVPKNAGILLTS
jgi:hypothetical protein